MRPADEEKKGMKSREKGQPLYSKMRPALSRTWKSTQSAYKKSAFKNASVFDYRELYRKLWRA